MGKHNETGLKGEQIAVKHLENIGYSIICCNWRHGHREIDCIASKDRMLVMVEIKTRSSFGFGYPEESVNESKKSFMKQAAEAYLEEHPFYEFLRFDIISVLLKDDEVKDLLHIEDAFY